MLLNPFRQPGRWFKANLHTHTTFSDGKATLDERIEQYGRSGYSVLAVTDHGLVADVSGKSSDELLVVSGAEYEVPGFRPDSFYHLVCLNLPAGFERGGSNANELAARAEEAGGLAFLAHPYWSANHPTDVALLHLCPALEVFNTSCVGSCNSTSSVHWDQALDLGLRIGGLATDDTHSSIAEPHDALGGYTVLRMPELSVRAVLEAVRTGCYYSSSGPRILDFEVRDGTARVECEGAEQVRFIGWGPRGKLVRAAPGRPLRQAEVPVGPLWRRVRVEVVDAAGRLAWTNPIFLDGSSG